MIDSVKLKRPPPSKVTGDSSGGMTFGDRAS